MKGYGENNCVGFLCSNTYACFLNENSFGNQLVVFRGMCSVASYFCLYKLQYGQILFSVLKT